MTDRNLAGDLAPEPRGPIRTHAQKPSVGRIVHYRSYGTPGGEYLPECRAAIITEVGAWIAVSGTDPETDEWVDGGQRHRQVVEIFDETACHITVENPGGTFKNVCRFDVPPTNEDGSLTPTPGTWHWPERV